MPPQKKQPGSTTLRRTVDVVTGLAVLGLFGGLGAYHYSQRQQAAAVEVAASDVVRFGQMIQLRAATKDVTLNARGWPPSIDPAWFGDNPPRNTLVSSDRPWVEVASGAEADLHDPLVRMTIDPGKASFWYNPYQGVVRARVPVGISDDRALRMYNRVNGTALTSIYSKQQPAPAPAAPAVAPSTPVAEATGEGTTSQAPVTTASAPESSPADEPAPEPPPESPEPAPTGDPAATPPSPPPF